MLYADLVVSQSLGEPEKVGVLAKSCGIWLFHFTVQALWNCQALPGSGKMLFKVDPSRLPRA